MVDKTSVADYSSELADITHSVARLNAEDDNDNIALNGIITTICDLTDCRTKRIFLANDEVPPPVMNLTVFMSILLLIGFIILGVQDFLVHIFMIVSLATTVQFIINLLVDLNNPFNGVWNISKNHYLELEQQIEDQIKK